MSLLSVAETSFSRIIDTDFSLADDLGHVVVDVNYLNVEVPVPNYQIFIC
jgi:hypothetical protein